MIRIAPWETILMTGLHLLSYLMFIGMGYFIGRISKDNIVLLDKIDAVYDEFIHEGGFDEPYQIALFKDLRDNIKWVISN
jgi:hypothetical protein